MVSQELRTDGDKFVFDLNMGGGTGWHYALAARDLADAERWRKLLTAAAATTAAPVVGTLTGGTNAATVSDTVPTAPPATTAAAAQVFLSLSVLVFRFFFLPWKAADNVICV